MKNIIKITAGVILSLSLGILFILPATAEAGSCHHRYGYNNSPYYNYNNYGYPRHRHHKRRHYKHRHKHAYRGYRQAYGPPRGYYNRPYNNGYPPQPYGYGRMNYPPAPGYGFPANIVFGFDTGNAHFRFRY